MSFDSAIAELDTEALKEFGEEVTYTPAGGTGTVIRAVFDEFHAEQDLVDGHIVQMVAPAVIVDADDVDPDEAGTEGDTIRRAGVTYYVTRVKQSGRLVTLILSRDATAIPE